MKMKAMTLKVDARQDRELEKVSARTRISKSELVREGIDLAIRKYEEGQITPAFRKLVDRSIREDARLLKRLKDA